MLKSIIISLIILNSLIQDIYSQPLFLEKPREFRFIDNSEKLLETLGKNRVEDKNSPGFVLEVFHENQLILSYSTGLESLDIQTPLSDSSQFYLASIGKTMTASAILKLVERKYLKLEAPISSLIEGLPPTLKDVRVYHLLSHTSGIPDHFDVLGEEHENLTNRDVLKFVISQDSLLFEPSLDYSYSNSAYVLLALIVESVSRESFSKFLSKEFFKPLGMNSTRVFDSDDVIPDSRVKGYKLNSRGEYILHDYSGIYTTGSGGIYSTIHDLEIWIEALTEGRIIKNKRLLNLMFDFPTTLSGYKSYIGMGWTNETMGRHTPELETLRVLGSIGFMKGFVTKVLVLPDQNLKIYLLCNSGKMEISSAEILKYYVLEK